MQPLPVDSVARSLAAGEAVFWQLFPAVMIARLVSLEIAKRGSGQGDGAAVPKAGDLAGHLFRGERSFASSCRHFSLAERVSDAGI